MKIKLIRANVYLIAFLIGVVSFTARAQKQPKIQKGSVRAPADIKIDGAIKEWPYNLQAFNSSSRVYYTVSNDDTNLYLALRSTGLSAGLKILEGGLTFTVKTKGNNVSVTYPTGKDRRQTQIIVDISYRYDDVSNDTIGNRKIIDSVQLAVNSRIDALFNDIKVTGINNIPATIPLNNTYGIQAKAQYNNRVQYIYELAVPLKYLGLSVDNPEKFKYNVILNPVWSQAVVTANKLPAPVVVQDVVFNPNSPSNIEYLYNNSPTNMSGDYTLVK
jgi:hypothetical protein